ncbi:hypothetical protein V496_06247 [Pseudogymnoascus sp. VKM F-4515 (FW-2607)]|nr:hypothetical protein V496_06247 [Pseudogymnoascus sp. VKM F-4515 (FW-2607)]
MRKVDEPFWAQEREMLYFRFLELQKICSAKGLTSTAQKSTISSNKAYRPKQTEPNSKAGRPFVGQRGRHQGDPGGRGGGGREVQVQ